MRLFLSLTILILVGCGTHPLSQTAEQRQQQIRLFFADAVLPEPGETEPAIPFKYACFKHLEALYFIINSPQVLEASGIPKEILNSIPQDFEKLKGEPLETILKALSKLSDDFFRNNQTKIETAVQNIVFDFDELKSIQVPKLGKTWTEFFEKILHNYFPSLPLEDKSRILAFALRSHDPKKSSSQAVLNWVYASGPFFQKYLQLMADYLEPGNNEKLAEFKKSLMEIKQGLPSIHNYHLQIYLQELHQQGVDLEIIRSLGAASVGQAFLAKNKSNGQQLVVKFMRPGIEEIAKREREYFKNQALLPALKSSFDEIAAQITEELDYRIELDKIKKGITAYEGDSYQIHVVRPIESFPNGKRYFAMELVDGKTFKQLGANKLEKLAKALLWERVTRKFMYQALWARKNGFFHGDLHDGNIMVVMDPQLNLGDNPSKKDVEEAINKDLIKVVLIDFGNAHELNQETRRRLKDTFLSSTKLSNSSTEFLKALYVIQKNFELVQEILDTSVFDEAHRADSANGEDSAPQKIGKAMDVLLENGKPIPGFLMAFQRCLGMLNNIYDTLEYKPERASLHYIAQDTYVTDLKELIEELSPDMLSSLLDGIVLKAQAADWEGDQIEAFLNEKGLKEKWSSLRTRWAAETDFYKKKVLLFEMAYLLGPSLVKLLPQTTDSSSHLDTKQDSPQSVPEYIAKTILSGAAVGFEAQVLASLTENLEAKEQWIQARKNSDWGTLLDLATPIINEHGPDIIDLALPNEMLSAIQPHVLQYIFKTTPANPEGTSKESNKRSLADHLIARFQDGQFVILEKHLAKKLELSGDSLSAVHTVLGDSHWLYKLWPGAKLFWHLPRSFKTTLTRFYTNKLRTWLPGPDAWNGI